jgi:UPF0716 family protein affecting phage T7 exclusion
MGDPEFVRLARRHGRRVVVAVVGGVVVLAGLIMCVLPGPGLLTVAAGLAILATEFEWARRMLHRVRRTARATYERARGLPPSGGAERPGQRSDTDAAVERSTISDRRRPSR